MKQIILVADTNAKDRRFLLNLLTEEKFKVVTAQLGCDVIKKVQSMDVDIVIMDVDLVEMKGYEIVPILKKINSKLPIIMMSSDNSLERAKRVREKGVFYYAIKPLDTDEIKAVINDATKTLHA